LVLSAAAIAGCAGEPTASAQSPAVANNPDQVVAEVAGKAITLKDVDAKWEEANSAERARITQALYDGRRNMLDQMVGDELIANAAKAAGQSVDAFVSAEAAKRIPDVRDEDVKQFYDQNRDRLQGRTFDQLRVEIKAFLETQRSHQARAALIDELRSKNANSVKVMFEAPRYTVATTDKDPVRGNAAAPVTIVEFSDYQCPYCARVTPTLAQVRAAYGDKVKIIYKDFPLPNHPLAQKAAEAARCAGEQKKYWEMHDAMFANQQALAVPGLKQTARALGLDGPAFDQCLDSGRWEAAIQQSAALGEKLGVNSTPTLYVNGRPVVGAMPFESFKSIIDEELQKK
jgi:protein-disulfide isomerase